MRRVPFRAFAAIAVLAATPALAQTYPTKPITLIVPYAPGGAVDAVARPVAQRLAERLGQNVVVENVAGAGGVIGTTKAAAAPSDGHTLLLSVESTMAIAKLVTPGTVTYDPQKDFAPITLIGTAPLVLVGKPALEAKNTDELLKLLRANPGKFNYATSGVATSLHLAGEIINLRGKVKMTHVPYRVGAQIATELAGNQIDLALLPLVSALPHIKDGRMKAYGLTEARRAPSAPDIPSLSEHPDLQGVDVTVWFGLFAPAKTDPAIVARLHRDAAEVLKHPELAQRFATLGLRVSGEGPEGFKTFLAAEIEKFAAVVKAANIKAE